ncbi:MAG: hypothetical protein QOJ92_271 [Frankiales bacterium]|nr:hypothetical protein [Frankiales bacterium]
MRRDRLALLGAIALGAAAHATWVGRPKDGGAAGVGDGERWQGDRAPSLDSRGAALVDELEDLVVELTSLARWMKRHLRVDHMAQETGITPAESAAIIDALGEHVAQLRHPSQRPSKHPLRLVESEQA